MMKKAFSPLPNDLRMLIQEKQAHRAAFSSSTEQMREEAEAYSLKDIKYLFNKVVELETAQNRVEDAYGEH